MLTSYDTQQPLFTMIGRTLFVNHSYDLKTKEDMNGSIRTEHSYIVAKTDITANREQLIEAIIASKYSITQELSIINNQSTKPDEYLEYQNFRSEAKIMSDQWLNQE